MQDLAQGLRLADDLLKDGTSDVHELNLGFSFPSLNRAAWQTAERTGALALMDYDEVKELSELYELQDLVVGSQRQLLDRLAGLSAIMGAGEGGDPTKSAAPGSCRCFARGCSTRAGRSAYTARWPPAWRTPIAARAAWPR